MILISFQSIYCLILMISINLTMLTLFISIWNCQKMNISLIVLLLVCVNSLENFDFHAIWHGNFIYYPAESRKD